MAKQTLAKFVASRKNWPVVKSRPTQTFSATEHDAQNHFWGLRTECFLSTQSRRTCRQLFIMNWCHVQPLHSTTIIKFSHTTITHC